MEFIDGQSLGQILYERGAFAPVEALRTVQQIAEALRYLHREGYLHRDIKPDNVLVDRSGRIKLCDLGFVVAIPSDDVMGKRAATAVGTTGYMAPEVRQGAADAKVGTDIYSLGILLYSLLSGQELSFGASSEESIVGKTPDALPMPDLSRLRVPEPVLKFLQRMIEPERSRRFPSILEVFAALDAAMACL